MNIKDGVQTNNDSRCHGLVNFVSNYVKIKWRLRFLNFFFDYFLLRP